MCFVSFLRNPLYCLSFLPSSPSELKFYPLTELLTYKFIYFTKAFLPVCFFRAGLAIPVSSVFISRLNFQPLKVMSKAGLFAFSFDLLD